MQVTVKQVCQGSTSLILSKVSDVLDKILLERWKRDFSFDWTRFLWSSNRIFKARINGVVGITCLGLGVKKIWLQISALKIGFNLALDTHISSLRSISVLELGDKCTVQCTVHGKVVKTCCFCNSSWLYISVVFKELFK